MSAPVCIAVDWGTTSLRAVLLGGGAEVLARTAGATGILAVEGGRFAQALDAACGEWRRAHSGIPVVMSGMIGSQQGWVEAPYLEAPCGLDDLVRAMIVVPETDVNGDGAVHILPGVRGRTHDGVPEIMRGEETQIGGIVATEGVTDGLFCIPGTHSKWVRVARGKIRSFATFMTGECYAVLKDHSILGRLMTEDRPDPDAFAQGLVRAEAPGGLLHRLFAARTLGISGEMPNAGLASYLSGQLIGAEIIGARELFGTLDDLHLLAAGALGDPYRRAFALSGLKATAWDAEAAALAGLGAAAATLTET